MRSFAKTVGGARTLATILGGSVNEDELCGDAAVKAGDFTPDDAEGE